MTQDAAPKVRFITRKWAPAIGGMETYCLRLTQELSKTHDLDIIALAGQADGAAPRGLDIIKFGLSVFWKQILRPKSLKPADIIHISDMASWPLGYAAKLRSKNSKIIISAHGSDLSYAERGGLKAKLYGAYLKLGAMLLPCAMVISNSDYIADLVRKRGFNHGSVVALATDLKSPKPPIKHRGHIFYAGRILKSKGLSFFIEHVLPDLPQSVTLRVAGTIWDEDDAKCLGRPRVTFLGSLDQQALASEYASAACVIVPSLGPEGFGLVSVEAAICGGVVVASDHSGLAQACEGGVGICVPADQPSAWVDIITQISGWSQKERAVFTATAQKQAERRYRWPRVARETIDAYSAAP